MDPEAAAVINPHLLVGEEILWCGRPRDTSALRWRAGAIIVVAIAALVMRSIPLGPGLAERADSNSILLAVLVGVLIAEAIVFHSYLSKTYYGVTNQRVIIVSGLREPQMVAVLLDRLNAAQLRIRRIYRDIELRAPSEELFQLRHLPFTNPSVLPDWSGWPECYRLIALEDARRVCDLIVESAQKLK